KAGASYNINTFVSHPWVITDASDKCLGIFTPDKTGKVSLGVDSVLKGDISSTPADNTGSDTSTNVSNGSTDDVRPLIDCLIAKNPAATAAYEAQFQAYTIHKEAGNTSQAAGMKTSI